MMAVSSGQRINERVRVLRAHEVTLQREPVDEELAADHLLIRCHYSLISPGTELGMFTGSHGGFARPGSPGPEDRAFPGFRYPTSPGYAAVGEVELVGADVTGFSPGDLVYYPGRHQRYATISPRAMPVLHVPAGVALTAVPFARFGQISGTALAFSEAGPGDVVAVVGLGLIGNLAAQLFRARGAFTIGADLVPFRRTLADQAGIDRTVAAEHQDLVLAVREASGGDGARTVIEATGNPRLVEPALQMARPKGEVILLGSPLTAAQRDEDLRVYLLHLIHRKGVSVKGAHESLIPRIAEDEDSLDQRSLARTTMDLLAQKKIMVDRLISDVVRPAEIGAAYAALLAEKDKTMTVLIDWTAG